MNKIHILRSPDRNYLGHQDFPVGIKEIKLTIESAKEEIIPNVLRLDKNKPKLIIRFKEQTDWIKPFICNITNRKLIFQALQKKKISLFCIDDLQGVVLTLVIGKDKGFTENVELDINNVTKRTKVADSVVNCLRVKDVHIDYVSIEQVKQLTELINKIALSDNTFTAAKVSTIFGIASLDFLPINKFNEMYQNLNKKIQKIN